MKMTGVLGAEALAAAGAAAADDLAATHGGHARTETMAALANKLGGLIGALHEQYSVMFSVSPNPLKVKIKTFPGQNFLPPVRRGMSGI
jgi:hypothetical protein